MGLMLLGSAGLVAVVASLVISFSRAGGEAGGMRLGVLLLALLGLFLVARSPLVDRVFSRLVRRLLARHRSLDVRDYARLLELAEGWAVVEMFVRPDSWLAGRTVAELALRDEGLALLGVHRPGGDYLGVPVGGTHIEAGDQLLVYGSSEQVADLDGRPAGPEGDAAHERAVAARREEEGEDAGRAPGATAQGRR